VKSNNSHLQLETANPPCAVKPGALIALGNRRAMGRSTRSLRVGYVNLDRISGLLIKSAGNADARLRTM